MPPPSPALVSAPPAAAGRGAGVYVHVPFCAHHCDYCDFAVTTGADEGARRRYVRALHAELDRVAAAGPGAVGPPGADAAVRPPGADAAVAPPGADAGEGWPVLGSLFVGGGTPTLLAPGDLAGVLRHVRAVLPLAADAEVTVEANPESVDERGLAVLVAAGLDRISLGAQSFAPGVLATLGRRHRVAAIGAAVAAARAAGVRRVSVDLIYGTPGEREADWRASLEAAVGLGVGHVSCYALTVEANTPFGARVRRGEVADVDEDVQAQRMELADELLRGAGLRRYEVSNWARPGEESVHNRVYWRGGDWLAIGASAHGHWGGRRWWNLRPTGRYVEEVEAGRAPLGGEELPDADQRRAERLLTGLRTVEGAPWADVGPLDGAALASFAAAGLLLADDERVRATPAGLALADAMTIRLLPA